MYEPPHEAHEGVTEPKKRGGFLLRLASVIFPLLAVLLTLQRSYARTVERQTLEILKVQHARVLEARAARTEDPATHAAYAEARARYEQVARSEVGRKVCGPRDAPCRLPAR